jgi:GNAT superfamily N-acetyltransferase
MYRFRVYIAALQNEKSQGRECISRNFRDEAMGLSFASDVKRFQRYDRLILTDVIRDVSIGTAVVTRSKIHFDLWEISWVCVLSGFRNRGLATKMIKLCEQHVIMSMKQLEAPNAMVQLCHDASLLPFYTKLGYVPAYSWDNGNQYLSVRSL